MVTSWKCAFICCYLLEICLVNDRNLCLDGWMYEGEGSIFSLWYCIVCYYLYTYIYDQIGYFHIPQTMNAYGSVVVYSGVYFWFNINERVPPPPDGSAAVLSVRIVGVSACMCVFLLLLYNKHIRNLFLGNLICCRYYECRVNHFYLHVCSCLQQMTSS